MPPKNDEKIKAVKQYLRQGFKEAVIGVRDEPPYKVFEWKYEGESYRLKFHPDPFGNLDAAGVISLLEEVEAIDALKMTGRRQMIKAEFLPDSLQVTNKIFPCD